MMLRWILVVIVIVTVFHPQTSAWKFNGRNSHIGQSKLHSKKIKSSDDYLSNEDRPWLIGNKPNSGWNLGLNNFRKEFKGIFSQLDQATLRLNKSKATEFPEALNLQLSNEAVAAAEKLRTETQIDGKVESHPVAKALYDLGCQFLDRFFDQRPIERFWLLETVARIPYFAFMSMLHLYETLGWWREPTLRRVHDAEEWNELHHLLIMENLGGDKRWSDRFLGYHAAILYYWFLVVTYLFSPRIAYQFMELLEAHAVDTYGTFLNENAEKLKTLPAPDIAVSYYTGDDLYQFDEFQANREAGSRRPPCDTLFDVFNNIKDDEWEHVATMRACQEYCKGGKVIVSPNQYKSNKHKHNKEITDANDEKRKQWSEWASKINEEKNDS